MPIPQTRLSQMASTFMSTAKRLGKGVFKKGVNPFIAPSVVPVSGLNIPHQNGVRLNVAGPNGAAGAKVNPRRPGQRPAPQAPRAPQIPQNNSPAGVMGNFFESMKSGFRRNLQEEFDLNQGRFNTAQDEMNPAKSTALLPTFNRAAQKFMPTFMEGIFDVFASLINSLLSLFKIKEETKKLVTDAVKPLGKALVSGNPGEGLANLATSIAPALVKGLTDYLGVNLTPRVAGEAAKVPQYVPLNNLRERIAPAPISSRGSNQAGCVRRQNRFRNPASLTPNKYY